MSLVISIKIIKDFLYTLKYEDFLMDYNLKMISDISCNSGVLSFHCFRLT